MQGKLFRVIKPNFELLLGSLHLIIQVNRRAAENKMDCLIHKTSTPTEERQTPVKYMPCLFFLLIPINIPVFLNT